MTDLLSIDGSKKSHEGRLAELRRPERDLDLSGFGIGAEDKSNISWDDIDLSDLGIPEQDTPILLSELLEEDLEPLTCLADSLVVLGHQIILAGRPKSGKTWLAMMLAKSVDLGEAFLNRATTEAKVLYIALEDGQRRIQQRAKMLGWAPKRAAFTFSLGDLIGDDGKLGSGISQLEMFAKDYDLIIVDTLVAALSGSTNENNNALMGRCVNRIARIAHDTNSAILLVHHAGKADYGDPFKTIRGASAIRGGYDLGMLLKRRADEREAILFVESRDFEIQDMTLRQATDGAGWEYVGKASALERIRSGRETLSAMLELDPEMNGLTAKQIAEARERSLTVIYKDLRKLASDGNVKRHKKRSTGRGKISDLWVVSPEFYELLEE